MCINLRKVTFSLARYEHYPNSTETEKERDERKEYSKKRIGYFHRWVDDVDTSKDIPYIKTMALVEDLEDGAVHMVEYYNLNFCSKQ